VDPGTARYRQGVDEELIAAAAALLRPHRVADRLFGDVGAALVTAAGDRYGGVCIDTAGGTGFCAEASAIAAMVTAGEYRIARIVAVWRNDEGALHVLPPCGRCREFIRQLDPSNLDTEVVLGHGSMPLRELLPAYEWPEPLTSSASTDRADRGR
jgi:cytidine deaminase